MSKNTMTDLVKELEQIKRTNYIEILIQKSKDGEFHDYRSPAVCGKMYAVQCFTHVIGHDSQLSGADVAKLEMLRKAITDGEYDEPFTKQDQEIVHKEIDEDPSMSEKDKAFCKAAMVAR